ncbi:DUF1257 domain-containing protein [Tumidithrix helvetica PCC 7403]|uniref:DUF1257 domain-containing protein n=1 Tax=Tumidithrix helvetica TaxID=3457545 RepID=UPI003CB65315
MSHFTTIKVQIKDGQILQQTLQELGFPVEKDTMVRGYAGGKTHAEYVVRQINGYDLGFRLQGDSYELVADFWGANINAESFVNVVSQRYAHKSLLATVQAQGFTIEEQSTLADGTVRVVVGRWS